MVAEQTAQKQAGALTFKVLDALDHPHGGRVLRVRVSGGGLSRPGSLRGKTLRGEGPRGEEASAKVLGFALTAGKPLKRLVRDRRLDLHVEEEGGRPPISLQWLLWLD